MPAETLPELLDAAAESGRGGLRFVDRRENAVFLGWDQVRDRALRARARLAQLGVVRGDRVGLVFRTSPAFFDAFFGVLAAGAVPVPLYPPVRLGRLDEYHEGTAKMLLAVGARLLVAEPVVARLLGEVVARCGGAVRLATLDRLPKDAAPAAQSAKPGPEDLALVQFSSGTTVDPKPVALTHQAILAQVEALNRNWRENPDACGVSWLPLYHDMGLIGCIFPAQDAAAELTLIPPELFVARPALWLRTISRYRGMVSPAPNFAYGLCLERIEDDELEGVDLSCWRVALNGAETVSPGVMRRFNERFRRWGLRPEALSPVYGLSEASLAVTFSALDRPFTSQNFDTEALANAGRARVSASDSEIPSTELVSVGNPLPGFEVEIRGADGTALPAERVGRLWVRGPSLMHSYLGRPEASRRALVDGWLDTGDMGFRFEGELYLTGRAKDVLILRGRNYPPEGVERALDGLDGVRTGCSAAVSYRRTEAASDTLLVFVEARSTSRLDRTELAQACRRRILSATGLAADRVQVLEPGTLPRTSSGKIRRQEALRRFLSGRLDAPRKVGWWRLLGAMARSRSALAHTPKPHIPRTGDAVE